jgi:serine/threonine-protein kinase
MIGETVTHYRILDKIGEGGMGVVYRAEDTRLGRMVAVKFLSHDLASDPLALERFQREARAASLLNHPHICALHDVGRHRNQPFLVMELLDGQTLRRRLDGRPLPIDQVLELGAQMADALDAAHGAGLIHRDIKSANVFVTNRGQIKVLDFGLAKRAAGVLLDPSYDTMLGAPAGQKTDAGGTLGTLSYMSPEQARGEELDGRSDLFSFGVVLYEMATGRDPFAARNAALILDAVLHTRPAPPSALNPRVPHDLDAVILKALEKDREFRYQSAAEMRADLKRLRRESGATVTPAATQPAAVPAPTAPVAAVRPGRRAVWAATGVLAVLAFAAGYALFRPGGSTIDSIAVLPFASSEVGSDTDYLTDGITETLINGLAQLPDLRVAARSLAFRYKRQPDVDVQKAGRELNVTAVVTGRITARGDRLVIQADLIRVADGSQIWGGQYNRPMTDLLAVQEQIAAEILDKISPRLSGEDKQRAMRRYTDNAEAYRLYLQGRYHWNTGTIEGYQNAISHFQNAIRSDAKYALAYAGLADSYLMLGAYWVEAIAEAKSAAEQAIALDPNLAEAHVALGHIKLWLDWDWAAAEAQFRRGIALDPRSALARNQLAMYLSIRGRPADAIAEARSALQLEPLSPIVNADLGLHLLYAGRRAEAVEQLRRTLDLDSNSVSANLGLGVAYGLEGRHEEAVAALGRALTLSQNSPVVLGQLGAAYARQGNRAAAQKTLADLKTLSDRAYVPASSFAVVHTALGDFAQALDWLERAYAEHDFSMPRLGIAPWFQPIRTEPRLLALLDKLGLPR